MSPKAAEIDPFDVRRALRADGLLRDFNDAGVLAAADIHVARRLTELGDERNPEITLAIALAVRAPRLGHVYVNLASIHETAVADVEDPGNLSSLPWPAREVWTERVAGSPVVAVGDEDDVGHRPLRLVDDCLYLDRYWRTERALASDLRSLSSTPADGVNDEVLRAGLERLFPGDTASAQARAAAAAVLQHLAVVAGGPGTGKTTTVARIVTLLAEQAEAAGSPMPLVAMAAPTGKAAARLEEAVHEEAPRLATAEAIRARLCGLSASTIHRLLGWQPAGRTGWRHHRQNRLPHDAVVVDEASMISLSLMASLVEAIRPGGRLVLVGDPGQLASVEAGAVLGDIVGPASEALRMRRVSRERIAAVTGDALEATEPPPGSSIGDGIVVLDRVHRFGAEIGSLANSIRKGEADEVLKLLKAPPDGVTWIAADVADVAVEHELAPVREGVVAAARTVFEAAQKGNALDAIEGFGRFRLLCAHRRGAYGVATWIGRVEAWMREEISDFGGEPDWYVGRPLLVTENDYSLRIYNGDTGIVVAHEQGGVVAAFERGGTVLEVQPGRLEAIESAYAMTIHKSQGSQFDTAAVLLPSRESRILTRELLYTAVTRARNRLILVGTEGAIRAAISQPVARASGLQARLWHGG
jgi:exodeoxyribonuclease V alpha subunit